MRKVALLASALALVASASAQVHNYDDLPGFAGFSSYNGYNYNGGWATVDATTIANAGLGGPPPSLQNAVFNDFGSNPIDITRGTDFDFSGGYFAGLIFGGGDGTDVLQLEGFDDGVSQGVYNLALVSGQFNWYSASYTSIDQLIFFGFETDGTGGNQWMGDNLTFNAVPEPTSMAALALGGLALLRRRRKAA